jgi:hypothetical protein
MTISTNYNPEQLIWILTHKPSGSAFAVQYGRVNGKAIMMGQGFTKGNVVSMDNYRRVRETARAIFG